MYESTKSKSAKSTAKLEGTASMNKGRFKIIQFDFDPLKTAQKAMLKEPFSATVSFRNDRLVVAFSQLNFPRVKCAIFNQVMFRRIPKQQHLM